MANYPSPRISKSFFNRRLHSLMGLWLALFLIEHLFVNSQAALMIGNDGSGFVRAVQSIRDLPYLPVIEIVFLAIPFIIHGIWGIKYALQSKTNSFQTDGSSPSLPEYGHNHGYTWQRMTSWILLVAVLAHVVHMRFIEYPSSGKIDNQDYHMVRISDDAGLPTIASRLGVNLYDKQDIEKEKEALSQIAKPSQSEPFEFQTVKEQEREQKEHWLNALEKRPLNDNEVIAVSDQFGIAELLMVRNTFKNPLFMILYTLFVVFACFHAFNGFWTFGNRWGITLTEYSQSLSYRFALFLMVLVGFFGLAAIWGTYWINLRQ